MTEGMDRRNDKLVGRSAELTAPPAISQLYEELSSELEGVTAAYNLLMDFLREPVQDDDPSGRTGDVLKRLAALLKFISQRLYCRLRDASIGFVRESGAGEVKRYSKELSNLRGVIRSGAEQRRVSDEHGTPQVGKNSRFFFAISSLYNREERDRTSKLVSRGLKKKVLMLPSPNAEEEESEAETALKMGCNVLVSPQIEKATWAARIVTMESLSEFVYRKCGDEGEWDSARQLEDGECDIDEELDELLNQLEDTSRNQVSQFVVEFPEAEEASHSEVVPRDLLRGFNGLSSQSVYADVDSQIAVPACGLDSGRRPVLLPARRTYSDSQMGLLLGNSVDFDGDMPSQVIRYKREPSPISSPEGSFSEESLETLSPSKWCFQVSHLVEEREEVISAIGKLGARVVTRGTYCKETTHLVIAGGATERTAAFLGCCAALKHVVTPRYVFESRARGRWIVGRLHEYERNPLLRDWVIPTRAVFGGWRVALFTTSIEVEQGITNVLEAGGCKSITPFRIGHESTAAVDPSTIQKFSHILVECFQSVKELSYFIPPPKFPEQLMHMNVEIYALELLHQVLCLATSPIFDATGRLMDGQKLPEWCYVMKAGGSVQK
ncbi:hypothetical protein, conserved [Trypanosoma brucei brucei TREU927]|uniref:BRCT domain-containing protein n=1 Tax=Trypanosoma brucei brucei (strain 927/4 GUTat10.1) TaxID=185431 RepID=Q57YW5_TRYB2|nr:hypothetical protein, conserved [Trypanosoma brucei brucei TREU927]AAX79667.1 hypothetical protein, conserved [Trypanosoma brucei]AAZ13113.1 hypothetical protein, conserved [Trypanosoma brucei brucei TREU927]